MKKARRWLLITASLLVLVTNAAAVAPFKKVSIATSTITTTSTTTTEAPNNEVKSDNSTASGTTKNPKLTGIPQIDYIWDPNLPRELRGYNLSSYPFFSSVPPDEDIHFKCDGLHDGFYASIEFKCQVYHHCVYGIRHDFLCANFTAFDQRTFICHFVSDVDCEGSKNYWNRNDDLYMATTTTSTTTTTTEPPPTPRRRLMRPLRPLRRPMNRRPIDDYYYDEEEYDDDYYEERLNRRRKQRPRHRKPAVDYEDDYTDDMPRRHSSRDRFRDEDELEDDYDADRRKYDRPGARNKSADRRKGAGRKPTPIAGRAGADERRSLSDDRVLNARKDKPKVAVDETADVVDTPPRRLAGRRRINEKRPSPTPADIDDLDDYEKPHAHALDQEEAAEEEAPPKVKTTPKPLEEFITPKAAPASVYARPRAPPRIARPVPVNEKKKFQYPVQKTATTASPDVHPVEEDYYEDEEYEDVRPVRGHARRRIVDSKSEDDEVPVVKRRNQNDTPLAKKPSRTTIRRPVTEKKHIVADEEDYDNTSSERIDSRNASSRRRPFASRTRSSLTSPSGRGNDDVDFVDDDYDELPLRPAHRLRPKAAARKGAKKPRPIVDDEEEEVYEREPERPLRNRAGASQSRAKPAANARLRQTTPATAVSSEVESDVEDEPSVPAAVSKTPASSSSSSSSSATSGRAASVRVVKRPFLPSRGGSPYLPRGLQPVGVGLKPHSVSHTTDSTPIDMGSTISGVHLLEHGAPILRDSGTTLPPRSALPVVQSHREPPPKITLDELYENDYDVTLNDALNPTLKPLAPLPPHQDPHQTTNHNRAYNQVFASEPAAPVSTFVNNNQSPAIYHNNNNNNNQYQQQQQHPINAYQTPSPSQSSAPMQTVPHPSMPLSLSQTLSQPQSLPLSPSQIQSQSRSHHQPELHLASPQTQPLQQPQPQPQQRQPQHDINNYNSDEDSYFSSTDIRRRAIIPAPQPHSSRTDYRGVGIRIAQHFYDDMEY